MYTGESLSGEHIPGILKILARYFGQGADKKQLCTRILLNMGLF